MNNPPKKTRGGKNNDHRSGKNRQSRGKKRRIVYILGLLLAALLALIVIGLIAYSLWSKAPDVSDSSLKVQETPVPVMTTAEPSRPEEENARDPAPEPSAAAATPEPTPSPAPLRRDDTYTVLVVGRDRVGMNTDTIMVGRLDCREKTLNIVSIPRDTLVNVPWAVKKANSIYGFQGIEGLVDGIEDLVGFRIDNYAIIDTFSFRQVIDCIGGVNFTVPIRMYYDDPGQNLHIDLYPGYQLLNGAQAESVVRFRQNNDGTGYPDGDIGRINTQHDFFQALARQVLSLGNISNLPQIIRIVTENTDTNLTSGNIAFYAQEFLKLRGDDIHFYTLPYDTVYIRGGSYVSIQLAPWLDMINTCLNPFNVEVTENNLDIITYSDWGGFYSTVGQTPGYESFYDYLQLQ